MRNVQKKTRSTIIDYRNGKYQGCVKWDTERRQGFGIVIDDDLSIYFSEWDDGKLNGLTFVYFVDGTYLYGNWRNNQPNGINIFKNSEFLLLANYHIGEPIGNAIVATTSMNYMFLLNSEQLIPKKSW